MVIKNKNIFDLDRSSGARQVNDLSWSTTIKAARSGEKKTTGLWRFRDAFYEVNAITSVETEHANRLKGSISNSKMTVKEVGSR